MSPKTQATFICTLLFPHTDLQEITMCFDKYWFFHFPEAEILMITQIVPSGINSSFILKREISKEVKYQEVQ
jgi:hypothetical protein